MSTNEPDEEGLLRTVTPSYLGRPDMEMDTVGWTIFLVMIVILVPFLPILVVGWLLTKLLGVLNPRR